MDITPYTPAGAKSRRGVRKEVMELKQVAYTPTETAELFGKEKTWGYRRIYDGTFKPITVGGRRLIPARQIKDLLDGGDGEKN